MVLLHPPPLPAQDVSRLQRLIGDTDAVIVADSDDNILFSKNAEKALVPASILKILTSLMALHYLGEDFSFHTEFYLDAQNNLKVKGYGDPMLISEILALIAQTLGKKVTAYNDLVLDDTYFEKPLTIPGVSASLQPYDAPNGALCTNFNTVFFKTDSNGNFISAEPQTPLLPFAKKLIPKNAGPRGRILIPALNNAPTLYAGHLLKYFLENAGIKTTGNVRLEKVDTVKDTLIYRYESLFSMNRIVKNMLEFSNNFMANQLFITTGIAAQGAPGSLDKGVMAAQDFVDNVLKTSGIQMVEGSGISRKSRVSAYAMLRVLKLFTPYYGLLQKKGNEFYKTGHLNGIRTRAGFIEGNDWKLYRFVVLLNYPGKTTARVMAAIHRLIENR